MSIHVNYKKVDTVNKTYLENNKMLNSKLFNSVVHQMFNKRNLYASDIRGDVASTPPPPLCFNDRLDIVLGGCIILIIVYISCYHGNFL